MAKTLGELHIKEVRKEILGIKEWKKKQRNKTREMREEKRKKKKYKREENPRKQKSCTSFTPAVHLEPREVCYSLTDWLSFLPYLHCGCL